MSNNCPGINSSNAGEADGCNDCPNKSQCSQKNILDPDIELIESNLSHISTIVSVMSGKGGVGKSTISRNLAETISKFKRPTCILDLDLSGPSIPRLTATDGKIMYDTNDKLFPVEVNENLFVVSTGYMQDSYDDPLLYHSSHKVNLLKKILKTVDFSNIEVLVIDTPPNITDEHLFLATYIKRAKSILVTIPPKISFQDVIRQIDFCKKTNITILGIVENMKRFVCENCSFSKPIFKTSYVKDYCENNAINYYGSIDINKEIAKKSDSGLPCDDPIYSIILNDIFGSDKQ